MSPGIEDMIINGTPVENVDNFVFLWSCIPNTTDHIKRKIGLASSAFGRLKLSIISRKDIPNNLKIRL